MGLLRNVLLQPLLGDGVVVVADVAQDDLGRVEGHGTAEGTDGAADNLPRPRPQEVGLCRALSSSRRAFFFHLSAVGGPITSWTYFFLTSKQEVSSIQLASRAATVTAHPLEEHFTKVSTTFAS